MGCKIALFFTKNCIDDACGKILTWGYIGLEFVYKTQGKPPQIFLGEFKKIFIDPHFRFFSF